MKAFLLVWLLSSLVSPAHAKSRYHAIEGLPVTVGGTGYHEVVLVHAAYLGDEHNDEVFRATIQADLEFFPSAWVYVVDNGSPNRTEAFNMALRLFWSAAPAKLTVVRSSDDGYVFGAFQVAAHGILKLPREQRPKYYLLLQHPTTVRKYVNFAQHFSQCAALALVELTRRGVGCGEGLDKWPFLLNRPWMEKLGIDQERMKRDANMLPHGTFAITTDGFDFLHEQGMFESSNVSYHTKREDQSFERFAGILVEWLNSALVTASRSPPKRCTANCGSPRSVPLYTKVHGSETKPSNHRRLGFDWCDDFRQEYFKDPPEPKPEPAAPTPHR